MRTLKLRRLAGIALVSASALSCLPAMADSEPFLGQIICFPFNFVPIGWAVAGGQLMSISQNTALFSLLGTNYGGNGISNFALPDLGGRAILNAGQAPALSPYLVGQNGGNENMSLTVANLPSHTHSFAPPAASTTATQALPTGGQPATIAGQNLYALPLPATTVAMATSTTQATGSGLPYANRQPYVTLTCAIALQGIFPTRP
jgi:microcystin-dependent protein